MNDKTLAHTNRPSKRQKKWSQKNKHPRTKRNGIRRDFSPGKNGINSKRENRKSSIIADDIFTFGKSYQIKKNQRSILNSLCCERMNEIWNDDFTNYFFFSVKKPFFLGGACWDGGIVDERASSCLCPVAPCRCCNHRYISSSSRAWNKYSAPLLSRSENT